MAKPHSQREIRERREQILLLMSKGLSQQDIARELHTTRQTISRDMRAINNYTNGNLNDLARETLSTMYQSCITGINEVLKECWQIYDRRDDSGLNWWHRLAVLRLAAVINFKKFEMFSSGPALMEIRRLKDRVDTLKREMYDNNNHNNYNNYNWNFKNKNTGDCST
jgi:transcriptional regulator